jgi:two-component system KDP operon response regulator KdpE
VTVILLVEDEAPNRILAQAVLARTADAIGGPPLVLEAPRLSTARAILAARPVDLVLLDIRLPDGDGLSLARELQARPAPDRPAIIVLSASALAGDRDAAIAAGATRFIAKPFTVQALSEAVIELLQGRSPAAWPAPGIPPVRSR